MALQIVGIGTSAGGVQALQDFFGALPEHPGAAFVVIMHLDPHHRSEMVAILANRTSMRVTQVEETVSLETDHVYVVAPNRQLRIADHTIATTAFDEPRGYRAPIDHFFRSLAAQDGNAFAIILTGAGTDGALGARAIKEAGGIVLVQDPEEAEYTSMPRNAIATETPDFVLPVKALAEQVVALLERRAVPAADVADLTEDGHLQRILALVRNRTGHDFSQYKPATVRRRIARRLHVTDIGSLPEYYEHLRGNVAEIHALFNDFLISVTTFFRDPAAFAALAEKTLPAVFEGRDPLSGIRIWVPGCATGEEAYSLGMLMLEEATRGDQTTEIQIFASDLDTGALGFAREGRYPESIEEEVSEERLRRFFRKEGRHYRVARELRDIVLFAHHSLLKDPPFSRVDLISCRNLLIYLDRELQQQVCSTFHYSLKPSGYLFLGSSETVDPANGLFICVHHEARIYRSLSNVKPARPMLPSTARNHASHWFPSPQRWTQPADGNAGNDVRHREMLERTAPPSILVNEAHHAIHLSESAGRFLQPSGGPLTTDIVDLVREELRFELRLALHDAFEKGESSLSVPIPLIIDGQSRRVYLQVQSVPLNSDSEKSALVFFIEGEALVDVDPSSAGLLPDDPEAPASSQRLKAELHLALSRLRNTQEAAEITTEELRAANEELQSINEEYRSTSEELETSREELQSINEELNTVNSELKIKLESISRAHNDLQNLMAATDLGLLFLDPGLRIKRFTPRLTQLFNLAAGDEGRPITDFTHDLDYPDMAAQAQEVLRTLVPVEAEVRSLKGGWYLARIRPYRTVEDKIDGVVVTFVDISERRRIEEALRESEEKLRQEIRLVELSRSPIFMWDLDGGIIQWNRGSEALYGYSRHEAIGRRKEDLLYPTVPGSSFAALRDTLAHQGNWNGEVVHVTKDGRQVTVETQIELITFGGRRLALESVRDVTEHKRWELRQQMLVSELTHRVRNTLTVAQSMARQTLRNAKSPAEFVERFYGRLSALANAHRLLADSDWQGAELGALVRNQLQGYGVSDPRRFRLEGPEVILPADLATPFGLVLHELATNAAKYGSLSGDEGSVKLDWHMDRSEGGPSLVFTWEEMDGPTVATPERNGLGSVLIKTGIPGASVEHDLLPEGVRCVIKIRIAEGNERTDAFP